MLTSFSWENDKIYVTVSYHWGEGEMRLFVMVWYQRERKDSTRGQDKGQKEQKRTYRKR